MSQQSLYTRSFCAMALANFATTASFGAFFLFPIFIAHRGGSRVDIGIIMGVFTLAATLCRPWVAELIDRIGRRRSYTLGSLLMVVMPFSYLLLAGPLTALSLPLLGLRIVHGVGLALCFTAAFTYVADIVPAERLNEGIGLFGISGLIGLAVGPAVAEMALTLHGFTAFFVAAAGLAFIGLLAHLPLRETLPDGGEQGVRLSFYSVLRRRKILLVGVLAVLFGFGQAGAGSFVAPLAEERHIHLVSMFFLAYSLAAIVVRLAGGRLADRVGERRIIPYALVITGGGLLSVALAHGTWPLACAGAVAGTGHGLLFPALNSLAVRDEPAAIRGKITGIYTGALDGGNFAGSVLLGFIGQWAGLPALFLAAGLALLLGLPVLAWERGRRTG
jgi:MFS family permease